MSGMKMWNLWHGCHKLSAGCTYCYVYMGDAKRGKDSSVVTQTKNFDLPIRKKRNGDYFIPSGSVMGTCFTSDFFVEDADQWRAEAWDMIRQRPDLHFFFITKRPDRFYVNLPADWGDGYDNVSIGCTVENQDRADYRLPLFNAAPIKRKMIICEPLLEAVNLEHYLHDTAMQQVVVGGESGKDARVCDYNWVLTIRELCLASNISFWFKQTGGKLLRDGNIYNIPWRLQHSQARKANINHNVKLY